MIFSLPQFLPSEEGYSTYNPRVIAPLLEAQEWDKLGCWIGVIWMKWPPKTEETAEDLKYAMILLFRNRPDVSQKLTQWMKRRDESRGMALEDFERIYEQACEAAQQDLS